MTTRPSLNYWQRQQDGRRRLGGVPSRRLSVAQRRRAYLQFGSLGAAGLRDWSAREHHKDDPRFDSLGRRHGRNRDGVRYTVCPSCSQRSSVQYPGQNHWTCERCGYKDNDKQPLN